MRAVVIDEIRNRDAVGIREVPDPAPGEGEVLIDVRACAVNFTDFLSLDGKYQNNPPPPFTPGKDPAGVVSAIGPGVSGVSVGDRVVGHVTYGGFAEKVVCPAPRCFVLPGAVSFEAGAALGLAHLTADIALRVRGRLAEGECVLVNGASGGVGLAAVGMARALGAGTVLAGLPTPSKAAAVREAGADAIVDLSGDDLRDSMREQVRAVTGRGVDLVLDLLGGPYFEAGLRTLDVYGRIVVTGFASGEIPTVRTNYLLLKNLSVVGMTLQTFLDEHDAQLEVAEREIFEHLAAGRIAPHVSEVLPFERFMDGIALIEQRKIVGKAVLTFG